MLPHHIFQMCLLQCFRFNFNFGATVDYLLWGAKRTLFLNFFFENRLPNLIWKQIDNRFEYLKNQIENKFKNWKCFENDFINWKWFRKTKMNLKNENKFEKWKWTWISIYILGSATWHHPTVSPSSFRIYLLPPRNNRPLDMSLPVWLSCPPIKSGGWIAVAWTHDSSPPIVHSRKGGGSIAAVNDTQPTQRRWRRNGRTGGFHLRKVPVTPRCDVLTKFSSFH